MLNLFPQPTLSQRLTMILHALRDAASARGSKDWSIAPAVMLLWGYLGRVARRFDALTTRLKAGKLVQPRARKPVERTRPAPKPRFTRSFAWLLRRVPEVTSYRSQFHYLLRDPAMAALLAEVPQAARLLRSLCRILGIEPEPSLPPALFPPKVPRKPRLARPTRPESDPAPEDGPALIAACLASA